MSGVRLTRRGFALTAALAGCMPQERAAAPTASDDPRPRVYALLDRPAPAFAFPKRGGGEARLADYAGKTLVLYFGGLWCPDCVADAPYVSRLSRLVATDPRLAFLQIHTRDRFGRWGSVDAFFAANNYAWPVAFDASQDFARDIYKIEWSPSFLVIDKTGTIRRWRTDLGAAGAADFFAQAQAVAAA